MGRSLLENWSVVGRFVSQMGDVRWTAACDAAAMAHDTTFRTKVAARAHAADGCRGGGRSGGAGIAVEGSTVLPGRSLVGGGRQGS